LSRETKLRKILEIIDLSPENGNTPPCLNLTANSDLSVFVEYEDLLRLIEIRDIAILINASGEVPSAGAVSGSSCD